MRKNIIDKTIYFYDDQDNEIMNIDFSFDDCTWYFKSNSIITITEDTELYSLLDNFMKNDYVFFDEVFLNYKDNQKLIWYSDCYCNLDDEFSIANVSCLNIEKKDSCFNIWCTKKLDEIIDRNHKYYGIGFSPLGNGRYSKNVNTGFTLQDDFIMQIYQPLLNKNKVLKNKL